MRLLFLSTALLDLRKLTHSSLMANLARHEVFLMTSGGVENGPKPKGEEAPWQVLPMPAIEELPRFPFRFWRRLNETAWDQVLQLECRKTMAHSAISAHLFPFRHKQYKRNRFPAWLIARLGLHGAFENRLLAAVERRDRCPEATAVLEDLQPDAVISTATNRFEEPAVMASARRLKIPALTYIHSMDTLSVKNRLIPRYDGFLVWSEAMREELHRYYPYSRDCPTEIVGACQYDVFLDPRYEVSREQFCAVNGLRADAPIVVYALGSPKFLDEAPGALALARRLARDNPQGLQLLIRPHPQFDDGQLRQRVGEGNLAVRVQHMGNTEHGLSRRYQDDTLISDWVNTIRHADVIINTASSFTVDGALLDTPVVNINFSPSSNADEDALIKAINSRWEHFSPLVKTAGLALAGDMEQVYDLTCRYLASPDLHRKERRVLATLVCGFTDGSSGRRLALAIEAMAAQLNQGR